MPTGQNRQHLWMGIHYPIKNGDFPIKNCDFPIKNGDFPIKNGDFPIKNGDFPISFRGWTSINPSYDLG